jgi:transglutaminase-like putative cysteine protease
VIEQQASHGWAEAHVAGLGWVGFDVSNAICPDSRYVRVAMGADYRDAAPVTGISLGSGGCDLSVELSVQQQVVEQ